ncbi:hydroxyacylglutathione hydrolase [Pancytospora philotis]|nr:hydroxyacylglutathione hydrolase [Pancytospora philotis]
MHFVVIRVREDNHMYLFYTGASAFAVDAYDPRAIVHALGCDFDRQFYTAAEILALPAARAPRQLVYALTTHSHFDHAGGDPRLAELLPGTVFLNHASMEDLSTARVGCYEITGIRTPCHTACSLSFLVSVDEDSRPADSLPDVFCARHYLLTGDFLFRLGCGRFFEGTAADFVRSLDALCAHCPDSALVLYGHDYSATNRRFAAQFLAVPGAPLFLTLGEEKRHNPFINWAETGVLPGHAREEVIAELRRMKDAFK